ncbi:hypothetical protein FA10DRAFT_235934 [Acaromyces ingoldii]|uniref:FUN34-transmembrane protein n=1 Tax=Acaromyces ingoldii TaxID=215250 RepID=A0A316YU72_9BASI|nr:hypothetical protein FA10DRAFT_235934 [Acaromyces ingoldii]PWN92781.1 hypothetical protein FA10DRAFT_235934 [Acaromyces ingoldii]
MSVANNAGHNAENTMIDAESQKKTQGYNGNGYSGYQDGAGFTGGNNVSRTITPGGHPANDDLLAVGAGHRKLANPLPLGAMSFATTTLVLSLYNVGVQGIKVPNAIVAFSLFYGGFTQWLAGLWEFASGNTLGASIFVSYGMFWWGFSFIFIPFFGETGSYDGVPGVYAKGGLSPGEMESAVGLFLWIWFGITTIFLIASVRSSVALAVLLFVLDLTFAFLGAFYYTGNPHFQTAGGGLGIATAFIAYYLAFGSFFTPSTSYFTLPLVSLAVDD